jgi:drug/metabolite transporter (DMT)-like permease
LYNNSSLKSWFFRDCLVAESVSPESLSRNTGIALILLGSLAIGVMPSAAKIAYQEGANPLAAIVLRSVVGFIGIGLYLALRRATFSVGWRAVRSSSLTGVYQSVNSLGIMAAVAYIDISVAVLIIFCFPLWVALYNHFWGGSRITPLPAICFGVSLCGLALALGTKLGELNATGLTLAFMGMISMAVLVIAVTDSSRTLGPVIANFLMTGWTATYFLLIALIGPMLGIIEPATFPSSLRGWIAIASTGVSFTLGYVLFFVGAVVVGSTRAAMLTLCEPVLIILLAMVLVDEWLTPLQWLGVALVVGSLLVLESPRPRRT